MTVNDLIYDLKNYRGDAEVMITMYQRYGSDFAYTIESVDACHVTPFWGDQFPCVQIVMGTQEGNPISEEYDDNFSDLDEELLAEYDDSDDGEE